MNVTLIGMPGAGKSFIGRRLAQKLGLDFLDVDRAIIEPTHGKALQDILDELGDERFITVEGQAIIVGTVGKRDIVISPGGSVVYRPETMEHLKEISTIIYLKVSFPTLEARVGTVGRGIVGLKGKTFKELYDERTPLYEKYADMTVDTKGRHTDEIVEEIIGLLED